MTSAHRVPGEHGGPATTEMRPCPFQLPEGFSGEHWAPTHSLHTHAASLAHALHGANPHPDDAEPSELLRTAQYVRDVADEAMREVVEAVRAKGLSWGDVGKALGISRQAAQQRFGGGK